MQLMDTLRKCAGWCPMAAAAQQNKQDTSSLVPQAKAADAGPVAERARLFSKLTLAIVGIAWIAAIAALPFLPDFIPVHWNIYGDADGFAPRLIGTFSLPVIMTIVAAILVILPRIDSMRVSFDNSRDIYAIVIFATACLLLGLELTTFVSSAGMDLPVAVVLNILLGTFFMVIGGLMPYIRRNTTIGFRLPWTIRSEWVWDETHRHGGSVFIIAGILIVLVSIAGGKGAMPLAFGILAVAIVYITAWSYRLAQAETGRSG